MTLAAGSKPGPDEVLAYVRKAALFFVVSGLE
jgi:hypothetical protein